MITVVNKSTLVSDDDVALMTRACARQLRYHAAPAWRLHPMPVVYAASEADAPAGSWVIGVMDDADQAGILGWHTEDNGVVYGRVFAQPVLENGGDALSKPLSVASVLSHEVLETFVDPSCVFQASWGDGAVALEVADPVESDSYSVRIEHTNVTVSDFVLPAWFDPQDKAGPWDHLQLLDAPLTLRPGGYAVVVQEGQPTQVFGERYPDWRKATKATPLARGARRRPIGQP